MFDQNYVTAALYRQTLTGPGQRQLLGMVSTTNVSNPADGFQIRSAPLNVGFSTSPHAYSYYIVVTISRANNALPAHRVTAYDVKLAYVIE